MTTTRPIAMADKEAIFTCPTPLKPTGRQQRLLRALLRAGLTGVCSLELREVTGALNVAEVVSKLRHRYGIPIICEHFEMRDRDGRTVTPGRYRFGEGASERLAALGWIND